MPLFGESSPNVRATSRPSTPNCSLYGFGSTNGVSGMPCAIRSILASGMP